jgi:hypothetical protein
MKITNNHNLPQPFMNVIEHPSYDKGAAHLSATELLSSPQIVQLKKKHYDDLEEDAMDMVWSLFGTAIHNILEQGADDSHLVEERIHAQLDGWNISGAIDLQRIVEDGVEVNDYKTVGVYGVMNEKKEWEEQLNIYAWLVEKVKKQPVVGLKIIAIIRDWSRRDAETRANYPKTPVASIDINLWPMEQREEFIRNRIHAHSEALFATETGSTLPSCTAEEMWEKETVFALKKNGAVRAKSLHATMEEAEAALEEVGKGFYIETRPGERTRCKYYCPVSSFCQQYQQYKEEQENAET